MAVVSDSSPIISFARAKKLALIRKVYNQLLIPPAVYNEIVIKGKGKPGAQEIKKAKWVTVISPKDISAVKQLQQAFDAGESEALVLAQEQNLELLIDEGIVINEARKRGIKITSTLITLIEAKRRGFITSAKIELDELLEAGFRCTPELYEETIRRTGEI